MFVRSGFLIKYLFGLDIVSGNSTYIAYYTPCTTKGGFLHINGGSLEAVKKAEDY